MVDVVQMGINYAMVLALGVAMAILIMSWLIKHRKKSDWETTKRQIEELSKSEES